LTCAWNDLRASACICVDLRASAVICVPAVVVALAVALSAFIRVNPRLIALALPAFIPG